MTGQRIDADAESLRCPGEHESGAVQLSLARDLFVKVSLGKHKEVPGCVVVGGGIASYRGVTEFEDVPFAVDRNVVGDVDPSFVLVVSLVLL